MLVLRTRTQAVYRGVLCIRVRQYPCEKSFQIASTRGTGLLRTNMVAPERVGWEQFQDLQR